MSTRGIIVFVAICAVIVVAGIATIVYRYGGFFYDAMQTMSQGSAFGRGKDGQACVDEALRRYDPTASMARQTLASGFVVACLSSTGTSSDVCDGAPAMGLRDQAAVRAWAEQQCNERGREGQGCTLIFLQVANYCHAKHQSN